MNSLLEIFYDDHEHALAQLDLLHKHLEFVRKGGELEEVKLNFISFSKFLGVALDIHFVQEEEALFPFLTEKIGPQGPVMVMEHEHDELRNSLQMLKQELMKEASDKEIVIGAASTILQVLREHIHKENQVLFPLAERMLTEEEWRKAQVIAGKVALR